MFKKEKNRICIFIFLVFSLAIFSGCGMALKEINSKSLGTKSDVFVEMNKSEPVPAGYPSLLIKASIKTHPVGYFLWESKDSFAGKPGFPFVFNIDGQAVVWKVDGTREITPEYYEKGGRIPDGGEGVRYILEKKIRLTPGLHRMFVGVPQDDYADEFDIVMGKESSVLELKPIYNLDRRTPDFHEGIHCFQAFFNGAPLTRNEQR